MQADTAGSAPSTWHLNLPRYVSCSVAGEFHMGLWAEHCMKYDIDCGDAEPSKNKDTSCYTRAENGQVGCGKSKTMNALGAG
jgi:hypothetical protein